MTERGRRRAWQAAAAVLLLLPAVMLLNALLLWQELQQARGAFLRNTAAEMATRLEHTAAERLLEEEPALQGVKSYESAAGAPAAAGRVLRGEALFEVEEGAHFRAYVPYHEAGRMKVAELELNPAAADFLTARPLRNLYLTVAAALAMAALVVVVLRGERRRAQLERLAELGQMSAVLAHEIRNPLGALKGFLQLAQEQAEGPSRQWLEEGVEQASRLERLVKDLLLYARAPRAQKRLVNWDEMRRRLEGNGVEFAGPGFEWETDAELLERLLLNLVSNAREAAEERVRVEAEPGRIRVVDDGPGLAAEVREKLFQPFVTTKAQGTGLGLAIAKNLAEALGAVLELKGAEPKGTSAELRWTTWR